MREVSSDGYTGLEKASCLVTLSGAELMLKGAMPGDAPLIHASMNPCLSCTNR